MPRTLPDPDACHEELSRCIIELTLTEPFFGHLLGGVVRVVDARSPSAGVRFSGGRYYLHINDLWFRRNLRDRSERVAVLKHEALHLVLHHLSRYNPRIHDRFRFGIAADLVVNQLIGHRWRLPEDGVFLSHFPGLPPNRHLEDYYERLGAIELPDEFMMAVWHSDHREWGIGDDPSEKAMAEVELVRIARQAVERSGGKLPGALKGELEALLGNNTASLDWRRSLRLFSTTASRTRIMDTLRRPSRRYNTFPGTRTRRRQRLIIAIDTSASITDEELNSFFAEVQGIHRAGAQISIVECDTEIHQSWNWAGRPPTTIHGRGGTRFEPLLAHLHQLEPTPDGCIYLTDGHGPAPTTKPPCPLLWVVPLRGATENLRFGRVLRMTR